MLWLENNEKDEEVMQDLVNIYLFIVVKVIW